ncbi:MAG: lecithin retinol acyltransferase family protein [Flavobacteriales bacterium]|nr:lecithin retinol acyltransferase family protein [Flavobacteriales bacterium]MBX2958738.1 lecithin retinol acyltransferase family protein [Flavobacteriales bacterium]
MNKHIHHTISLILPTIDFNSFKYNNIIGFTGSIVRRRLEIIPIYWHYAFIYGFDNNQRLILIENNEKGVNWIFWEDFIPKVGKWEFIHIETSANNFEKIISRAKERSKYPYHPQKNNCEHFVNFCVFEKLESFQVKNTEEITNSVLLLLESRLINIEDPIIPKFLKEINTLRNLINLERGVKELDDMVKRKIEIHYTNQ